MEGTSVKNYTIIGQGNWQYEGGKAIKAALQAPSMEEAQAVAWAFLTDKHKGSSFDSIDVVAIFETRRGWTNPEIV